MTGTFMTGLQDAVVKFNGILWGIPMMALILGISLYFTFKLGFIQKHTFRAIALSFKKDEGAGAISNFGAFVIALAAMVGTGNIIGVAAAISTGGPGALFWMIVAAFFGMATKYAESVLAVKYREKNKEGEYVGGPMYVLKNGLNMKKTAILFAVATAIMGYADALMQSNSIVAMGRSVYGISPWVSTLSIMALTAVVIFGGVKQIARCCKILVPGMAIIYIILCLVVIISRIQLVPEALLTIVKSAFSGTAVVGGAVGITIREAIRYGVSRGVLSNEAGSGSGSIPAAAAKTPNSVHQGLISSTTVFWDTLVICLLSGLAVIIAGDWQSGKRFGADLANYAFSTVPGGSTLLLISLCLFAFSTLIGWSYFTEKAVGFFIKKNSAIPVRVLWMAVMFVGGFLSPKLVWEFADTAIALMCIPNILALWLLRKDVLSETKKYLPVELGRKK